MAETCEKKRWEENDNIFFQAFFNKWKSRGDFLNWINWNFLLFLKILFVKSFKISSKNLKLPKVLFMDRMCTIESCWLSLEFSGLKIKHKKLVQIFQNSTKNSLEADQHKSYEVKHPNVDREASANSVGGKVEHSLKYWIVLLSQLFDHHSQKLMQVWELFKN